MKTAKVFIGLLALAGSLATATELDGNKLFQKYCAACHINHHVNASSIANLIGPPINDVMGEIKNNFSSKDKAVAYMQNYILSPNTDKAYSAVNKKFLAKMPSMKGVVSSEEISAILSAIYERYPQKIEVTKSPKENKSLSDKEHVNALFQNNCVACHTPNLIDPQDKRNLIGPPVDEVILHVKEKFTDKDKAVEFMSSYIMNPDPKKALCASMDKFGIMPSIKGAISKDEAIAITSMMFDTFPHKEFEKKEKKSREGISFKTIDTNNDGGISSQEFKNFRARRNNLDPSQFKHDLYFKKIDLDGDGKMDPEEFQKMRESKMKG